jgi:integrase
MPYKELMNWDDSKRRWHRFFKGTMYRVVASSLGPNPTREATRAAANAWWQKKEAELNGYVPDLAEQLPINSPIVVTQADADRLIQEPEPGNSLKECGQSFLEIKCGGTKPRTLEEIAAYITKLDGNPESINEAYVERAYRSLKASPLSAGRKKKHWGFLKRFITFLWERRTIESLPRNLNALKFCVSPQEVKKYDIEKVREVLASPKSRLRLYAHLALNCGMVNTDIANLKKDETDLTRGTITRRRSKTGHHENVPVVRYKLWPETLDLLRKHQSSHPTLFLTNMRGNPLLDTRIEDGKAVRFDMIVQQWRRARPGIPLKGLRTFAATLLESHPTFGRCTSLFLGHSPKSIKDRHYAAPPQVLFNQALQWLHDQLFPT